MEQTALYRVFATDYDETLAMEGQVAFECLRALEQLKAAKWTLILVTGRRLTELQEVFGQFKLFDRIVAENGGTLYNPTTDDEQVLTHASPERLGQLLKTRAVPCAVGRVLVASIVEYETSVRQAMADLQLDHHIIFNKGSIMVLPNEVNKATGLRAALAQLDLSKNETVGIGDGENDHSFLQVCGLGVAVQNAVPNLKTQADFVTTQPNGQGVRELIELLLNRNYPVKKSE